MVTPGIKPFSAISRKVRREQPNFRMNAWRRPVMAQRLTRRIGLALRGNYSLGLSDQTVFPEIDLDKIKRHQGMDVTIVTTAPTDEEALDLLKLMGMPFAEGR